MNIFLRELKANLKSLLIWSGIVLLLIVMAVAKFSAFAGDPEMLTMLDSMPPGLLAALSMQAFNLTTITGFYGVMFVYFALMAAIAAAMWGSESISKEERNKTVEFSLVLPVSRSKVVTAKALAALVNCIFFVLITWGGSLLMVRQFHPEPTFYDFLRLEMIGLFLIQLIFLAIGLLLGSSMKRYKLAGSTAVGIILLTYFVSIVAVINEDLEFFKYVTPFSFFDAGEMLRTGSLPGVGLAISAGVIVVCLLAAYWIYNRRDLYI